MKLKLFTLFLLVFLALPTFSRLIRSGFFFMYDDMQVIRLQQMDLCVKDGQIPCRWVPDLGYGYGYPLYQYYAPLPYYVMEGVHLFDVSYIDSVKTGFALSIILSSVFFFLFIRHLLSFETSLVATLLYVYSPIRAADLYVRGAMGELWGLFAIPFVFWGIENHLRKRNRKSLSVFALTLGVLFITHSLSFLMILPFILFWIIFRIRSLKIKNVRGALTQFAVGGGLAFLLAGFFAVPLIFERSQVYLETLTQGYFNYINHFADLKQLFFSFNWGYGPSIVGPGDDVSISIGPVQMLLALIGGLLIFFRRKKSKASTVLRLNHLLILFVPLLLYLFMAHQRSTFVWKAIPLLSILQFPWRFLIPASFIVAILGSLVFELVPKKLKNFSIFLLFVTLLTFYGGFFTPKDWISITDEEKLSGELLERQLTASIYDYLPKSASRAPGTRAPDGLIVESGEVNVLDSIRGTNWYSFDVDVVSEAEVVIPTYDFPGWRVWVDGEEVPHGRTEELGLLKVEIDRGVKNIEARLTKSFPRRVGDMLTIFGIIITGILVIGKKDEKLFE